MRNYKDEYTRPRGPCQQKKKEGKILQGDAASPLQTAPSDQGALIATVVCLKLCDEDSQYCTYNVLVLLELENQSV